ncbi:MAG: histidine phosphatase family protein [Wenzhouxiangella sp.]
MSIGALNGFPRLCLIRHGQASFGTADYDRLSELGQRQGLALGERISAEYGEPWQVWCGTLKRHRQTLERVAPGRTGIIDADLNEYMVDQLVRSAVEQAEGLELTLPGEEAFADPKAYLETFLNWFPEVLGRWQNAALSCEHNGLWHDFHRRVLSPVERWQQELGSGSSAVVVTSAGVISTIAAELLGEDLAWQRELNITLYNASVTELVQDESGQWEMMRLNCVDHLAPESRTLA